MKRVKNAGVIFAIYWWKLLMENELSAIRWVDGPEIELIAIATSSRIVPRLEELILEKFDYATVVSELTFDIKNRKSKSSRAVTIFIHDGNKMIIEEAKRAIHDALCTVRNIIKNQNIVYGEEKAVSTERLKSAKTDSEIEDNQRPDINNSHPTNMNIGLKTYLNRKRIAFASNINYLKFSVLLNNNR